MLIELDLLLSCAFTHPDALQFETLLVLSCVGQHGCAFVMSQEIQVLDFSPPFLNNVIVLGY